MRTTLIVQLVILAIAVYASANPYSQAVNNAANTLSAGNTLDLSGSYGWAFSVTDQIKAQIAQCQEAIRQLADAVTVAENNKNDAYNVWQNAIQAQSSAEDERNQARQFRDYAQTALDDASSALQYATDSLDVAVAELQAANEDFSRKDTAWKLAVNIRDTEEPKKSNDITDLCSVLGLLGVQHGDAPELCREQSRETKCRSIVQRTWRLFLERDGTEAEISSLISACAQSPTSLADIVPEIEPRIRTSAIFRTKVSQAVTSLFKQLLGRDATSTELNTYVDSGVALASHNYADVKLQIQNTITEGREYQCRAVVYDSYRTVLKREPDAGGYTTYLNYCVTSRAHLSVPQVQQEIRTIFFNSNEYKSKNPTK